MPRAPGRRWRFIVSLVMASGLVAVPSVASSDPLVRFSEHAVNMFCDAHGPEGELHLFVGVSSEFGPGAHLEAWIAPVEPGSPPDFTGTTDNVVVVEAGGGATLTATIPLVDAAGTALGNVIVDATLTPTGDSFELEPFREGNRWIKTTGTVQIMAVTGTLDAPGDLPDFILQDLGCGGEIVDREVMETAPHAFVFGNEGIFVDCSWESEGVFAHVFAVNDQFGPFIEASLRVAGEHDILGFGAPTTLDASSLEASFQAFDAVGGALETLTVSASLTALGGPVSSTFLSQSARNRVTEQRLIPNGTLAFSTGDSFTLDDEHCFSAVFDVHFVDPGPSGPKAGGNVPANDTVDGAQPIRIGGAVNDQTRGASPDAELPAMTCPEPDDVFGRTLWYSFTGTGGSVTIDTAGSNFDTMVAVYDDELNEIACVDDVDFEPIGGTLQAAVTIDTVEDATYYVQVGGFVQSFFGLPAEFGRLRISVS
jgi:hypothetical protein